MNSSHNTSDNATEVNTLSSSAEKMDNRHLHSAHLSSILVIASVGLVLNSLSAAVWFKHFRKNKPGTFCLGCLSVADALFCLSLIFVKPMELSHSKDCSIVAVTSISFIFSYISRQTTVVVVVQRWMAVSRPSTIGRLLSTRAQHIALLVLTGFLLGFIVIEIYTGHLRCEYGDDERPPQWFSKWIQISDLIFFSRNVVTFTCLIVFSILLLYAACFIKTTLRESLTLNWHRELEQRMTIIVSCIAACSLLEVLAFLLHILEEFHYAELGVDVSILKMFHQWTLVLNSSINFLFYILFGRDFRKTLLSTCTLVLTRFGIREAKKERKTDNSSTCTMGTGIENNKLQASEIIII